MFIYFIILISFYVHKYSFEHVYFIIYVQMYDFFIKKIVMYVHNYIIFEYKKKSYIKFTVRYDSESVSIRYNARA